MSERNLVDFIEEWQTGFFVVIALALAGVGSGILVGAVVGPAWFFPGFVGGGVLAFLAYSYLRYGR